MEEFSVLSTFESFPNELLLDFFEYLDVRVLYRSFFGLNNRLDNILRSITHFSLVLSLSDDTDDPFLPVFASRIEKLIIDHSAYVNLRPFSRLHSLVLNYPCPDLVQQLHLHSFPSLVYLEFGVMYGTLCQQTLRQFLVSTGFPLLHTCIFRYEIKCRTSRRFHRVWSESPTLRSFWLSSFGLSLCSDALANLTDDQDSFSSIKVVHTNLKRLDICCISTGPSASEIDHCLVSTPHLERFKIAANEIYYSFNFIQQLASILQHRLSCLRRFDCEILCVMTKNDIDLIHHLHPCFTRIQLESRHGGQCWRLFTN